MVSEKCNANCVLLTCSEPESSLPVEGYQVFRDHIPLHQKLITDSSYLDNHLPNGNYEYYVVSHDVYDRKIFNFQFSIFNSIDVSELWAGIYFVRIATERGVVMRKVVKY